MIRVRILSQLTTLGAASLVLPVLAGCTETTQDETDAAPRVVSWLRMRTRIMMGSSWRWGDLAQEQGSVHPSAHPIRANSG